MVWGGIHLHGRTPLHLVVGNMTGVRYRDQVLRPTVLPTLQAMGPGATLQDDNATPHRARVMTMFLQHQINRMNWPACSPDLAQRENLGRHVNDNHPPAANLAQLFRNLQQEWDAIPQRTLVRLVESMRKLCTECIGAKGRFTHY